MLVLQFPRTAETLPQNFWSCRYSIALKRRKSHSQRHSAIRGSVFSEQTVGSCLLDSLFSFRCNSNRTSTVTRAQVTNCLALPDVRTRSGLQSLSYTATKEWNSLPPLIRCVSSQPAFLMHLRIHLGHVVKRLRSVGTA